MADSAAPYLNAVCQFADNVLKNGRDVYGPKHTPQFIDGINIDTKEPATWKQTDGREWVISNLGNQQILFRTLDGLTALTGNQKYKQSAREALQHAFDDLWWDGLLPWGGHMTYDATTDTVVWAEDKGKVQELKRHYPHYELMWETNPDKTRQLVEHTWNGHVYDWATLDFNRHGTPKPLGDLWDSSFDNSPVFFWGKGLTFINAGSDLFFAAAELSRLSNDPKPLIWARHLAGRYDATRNPKTGISGYQFSQSNSWCNGPEIRGDRAIYQYGDAFPDHHVVEGTLFMPYNGPSTREQICQILVGEQLGEQGQVFTQYAHTELTAWARVAYRESDNTFIPMLTDGTNLEGFEIPKEGYFGPKGRIVEAYKIHATELWAYALAYRITKDAFLWTTLRSMTKGLELGDIGESPQAEPVLNSENTYADDTLLFAYLELYRITQKAAYLNMAKTVGDHILKRNYHKGFFVSSPNHYMAKFDAVEPLALLHLVAAIQGKPDAVPIYNGGSGFYAAAYHDQGHQYDNSFLYRRTRR